MFRSGRSGVTVQVLLQSRQPNTTGRAKPNLLTWYSGAGGTAGEAGNVTLTRGKMDVSFVRSGFLLKDSESCLRVEGNEDKAVWAALVREQHLSEVL